MPRATPTRRASNWELVCGFRDLVHYPQGRGHGGLQTGAVAVAGKWERGRERES